MKSVLRILLIVLMLSCAGCASIAPKNQGVILGMVYDLNRNPIDQGSVVISSLDGGWKETFTVQTDVRGRFSFPMSNEGRYRVTFKKQDYETVETEFEINDFTSVLYLQSGSYAQLVDQAAIRIQEEKWLEAEQGIERVIKVKSAVPAAYFLKAVLYWKQGRNEEAWELLKEILKDTPDLPFVHKLAARILQESLGDEELALKEWQAYLRLIEDPQASVIMEDLEKKLSSQP